MAEQLADLAFLYRRVPEAETVEAAHPGAAQAALDDAAPHISVTVYGPLAELGHAYYAGHLLACTYPAIMGGEQGQPTTLTKGGISATFATVSTTAADPGDPLTTKYGRLFVQQRTLVTPKAGRIGV